MSKKVTQVKSSEKFSSYLYHDSFFFPCAMMLLFVIVEYLKTIDLSFFIKNSNADNLSPCI